MMVNVKEKDSAFYTERLQKILNTKWGKNNKTLEAFQELSSFSNENTLNSRRTLRSKIEKRGIHIIRDFLHVAENVKKSLDLLHENSLKMKENVDESIERLQLTKSKTFHLQEHMAKFIFECERTRMEQFILMSYLNNFHLTKHEIAILKQPEVNADFFVAIDRAQNIYNNCQFLLQCGGKTCALSLIEQLSFLQETAIEFLYRWTQINCKDIEIPKTAFLLTKAMKHFQNRMVLFSNLIGEYSTARRAIMVRLFIDALTKGGPGGNLPKPIETYVHDKKRYVGDMLAWLRQYIPTEKEYFSLFLKECNLSKQEIRLEYNKGMSNITEGICNILSVRIEYLVSSSSSPFELYDTTSLLRYYSKVISDELPDSALTTTISELSQVTECAFLNSIQNLVKHNLLEKIEAPPPDLSPSPGVNYLLNFTKEMLSIAGLTEGRKEFIVKVVNCILEPLLQAINLSASRLTTVDMAVYMLNCINEILNTLSLYEFVDDWLERLQAQAEAQIDTLTSEQASSLVTNLNLGLIYTIIQDSSKAPFSQVPGMDAGSLKNFLDKLDNFLASPGMVILPQIHYITNSVHRNKIFNRSFEVIIAVYKQLYKCVYDPENLYQDPNFLMPHSPEVIQQMLSHFHENDTL